MKRKTKWLLVAGARPNFMKIAPIIRAIKMNNLTNAADHTRIIPLLIHTGQHYDIAMSEIFFKELNIPKPDINLGIGSGGHGEQTGKIMMVFEKLVFAERPDLVIVVGDVNSTIACALVAAKLGIPVAHVEAGLRSFDRSMPEEINRILTDQISDFLFTHSRNANELLLQEGIASEKIFFVGNVMIDSLKSIASYTSNNNRINQELSRLLFQKDENITEFSLLTLHRQSNVDCKNILKTLLETIGNISNTIPVIFPVHPRTRKQIKSYGLENELTWINESYEFINERNKNTFYALPPLGYLDFIGLMQKTEVVFTDSGGVQEESTILGVPCITLRENTERPITLTEGTNTLVGTDPVRIRMAFDNAISQKPVKRRIPEMWDGHTAERIVKILVNALG